MGCGKIKISAGVWFLLLGEILLLTGQTFSEILITPEPLDSCFYYFSAIQKPDGYLGSLAPSLNYHQQVLGVFVFLLRQDFYRAKKILSYLQKDLKKSGALNPLAEESSEKETILPDPSLSGKLAYILAVCSYFKVSGDRTFLSGAENLGYRITQYLLPNGGLVSFNSQKEARIDFSDNLLAMVAFNYLGKENNYFRQVSRRLKYFIENYFDQNNLSPREQLLAGLAKIKILTSEQMKNFASGDYLQKSILAIINPEKEEIESLRKSLVISPDYPGAMGLPDSSGEISLVATAAYIFAEKNFNPLATLDLPGDTDDKFSVSEKFTGEDFEMWPWKLPFLWYLSTRNCQVSIGQSKKEHHTGEYSLAIDFLPQGEAAQAFVWRQFISPQDLSGYENISLWLKVQRISGAQMSFGGGSLLTVQLFLTNELGQDFFSRPLVWGGSGGFVNTIMLPAGLELSENVKNLALRKIKRIGVKITAPAENNWRIYLDSINLK